MPVIALLCYLAYVVVRLWDTPRSLTLLLASHRYHPAPWLTRNVASELQTIKEHLDALLEEHWQGSAESLREHVARRSIVLKWPRLVENRLERGVLLITFTTSLPYYYCHLRLDHLQRWFTIVLEPSWAGYCLPEILMWTRNAEYPVIVQATEYTDFQFLSDLKTNLVPVDFGASDWVDHRVFVPRDGIVKRFDAVYVGNYKPIKRHHVLFKAVSRINDPSFRVALACTPWGGGTAKQVVYDLMERYGVTENVTVYEGLSAPKLNELLNESKVCVLLSLKEGSNRSIFEAFFADVPGIVLKRNIGVNKRYINEHTGHLVEENQLVDSLRFFRERWRDFKPRAWALENISPEVSTRKLERVLQSLAESRGEPWTVGLRTKVNRPEVEYGDGDERFPMSVRELLVLFDRSRNETFDQEAAVLLARDAKSAPARVSAP